MIKHTRAVCVISAPSGTGKSTLIQHLIRNNDYLNDIKLSISYTTRVKRVGEIHGRDYYFISVKEFEYMIRADVFIEYAKVFDHYYGTSKYMIRKILDSDSDVILDIDWNGARQVRNKISNIYMIFILPPSREILEFRLKNRAQDTEVSIAMRMEKMTDIICHIRKYDYVVINDDFDITCKYLHAIILSEQLRFIYQKFRYKGLIHCLLKSQ